MISYVDETISIPLVWSVHEGAKGHLSAKNNIELVKQAIDVLKLFPLERITLFVDGEYSSAEFMKFLDEQNWGFVFRIAVNDQVTLEDDSKFEVRTLPVDVYCEQVKFNMIEDHFFNVIKIHDTAHKEPLALISNTLDGFEMEYEYSKRFMIERLFKNLKSNGCNIDQSKISAPQKVCNLLSIVVLAFLFVLTFKELTQEHAQNPLIFRKDRNDLSLFVACYQFLLFYFFSPNNFIFNDLKPPS